MLNITFIGNYLHIKRINYILNRIIFTHSCVSQWVYSLIKAGEICSSLSLLNHVIFENYIRLYTTTTSLASVVKRGPVLVKGSITNNEHIYLPPYCYTFSKRPVWKGALEMPVRKTNSIQLFHFYQLPNKHYQSSNQFVGGRIKVYFRSIQLHDSLAGK